MLTGCGRQVSKGPSRDLDLPAAGPDRKTLPTPSPLVSAALDATGGLAAWQQSGKIEFHATVTACERNGCFYLTEHDFVVCPWSDAIQVTAHEPRADFAWQVVGGRYRAPQADPNLDVSPLRDSCCDYAGAVLQIVTAPVRMLGDKVELSRRPAPIQIGGQWCLPIDAKLGGKDAGSRTEGGHEAVAEPHWTQGVYFQNQDRSLVDMVWLANPAAQRFLLVRGYDYTRMAGTSVLIPAKIEVFHSGPETECGPRLALIDLKQ
jgi:hypothetical protein